MSEEEPLFCEKYNFVWGIIPYVATYISKVLEHKVYPEQTYKSCSGILIFNRRVGPARLPDAYR